MSVETARSGFTVQPGIAQMLTGDPRGHSVRIGGHVSRHSPFTGCPSALARRPVETLSLLALGLVWRGLRMCAVRGVSAATPDAHRAQVRRSARFATALPASCDGAPDGTVRGPNGTRPGARRSEGGEAVYAILLFHKTRNRSRSVYCSKTVRVVPWLTISWPQRSGALDENRGLCVDRRWDLVPAARSRPSAARRESATTGGHRTGPDTVQCSASRSARPLLCHLPQRQAADCRPRARHAGPGARRPGTGGLGKGRAKAAGRCHAPGGKAAAGPTSL